jgi:hypothetical protein
MLSIHRVVAAATIAAALCVPATAAADDWFNTGAPAKATQDYVTPGSGQPTVRVVAPARTRIVEVPRAGIEWGDVAIGGAATLALVLLLAGLRMSVRPRRTTAPSS